MSMYVGSQLPCHQFGIVYRDNRDGQRWRLLGCSNAGQTVAVALGHLERKYMQHVSWEELQQHFTKVQEDPGFDDAD